MAAITVVAVGAALFIAGAMPFAVNLIPSPWDKLAHVALFALISMAIGVASGARGWRMVLYAFGGALLLGTLDELHQALLPGRNAGWDDLASDAAGALIGAIVLARSRRSRNTVGSHGAP